SGDRADSEGTADRRSERSASVCESSAGASACLCPPRVESPSCQPPMLSCGEFMNLPNSLTIMRIFLVPLLVVVLLTKFEGRQILGIRNEIVGAAIFGLASLTDWADGYLARRRKQITPLGEMIDPLADKLLTLAALISLVQLDLAPAWMVAVILGRDLAVTVLRSLAYARSVAMPASQLGKIKMIAQVVAILALILAHGQWNEVLYLDRIGEAAMWVAVLTSLASAADYFRRFGAVLNPRVTTVPTATSGRGTARKAG